MHLDRAAIESLEQLNLINGTSLNEWHRYSNNFHLFFFLFFLAFFRAVISCCLFIFSSYSLLTSSCYSFSSSFILAACSLCYRIS
jgi:hypothetical protein